MAQLRAFSEAAARSGRRRLRDELINLRASQYNENDYGRYLKSLEKDL